MKKLLIALKRFSWSLLLGGTLLLSTACSTGTNEGNVNVEESDFKDKSPTEHNAAGTSDNTQDNTEHPTTVSDSAYEEVYDQQEQKMREKDPGTTNQGVGGAAETKRRQD